MNFSFFFISRLWCCFDFRFPSFSLSSEIRILQKTENVCCWKNYYYLFCDIIETLCFELFGYRIWFISGLRALNSLNCVTVDTVRPQTHFIHVIMEYTHTQDILCTFIIVSLCICMKLSSRLTRSESFNGFIDISLRFSKTLCHNQSKEIDKQITLKYLLCSYWLLMAIDPWFFHSISFDAFAFDQSDSFFCRNKCSLISKRKRNNVFSNGNGFQGFYHK